MISVLTWLVFATAPETEQRGSGLDLEAQRTSARVGGSLSGHVGFGLAEGIGSLDPKVGLGLAAELGVVLNDRVALHFHAEFSALPFGLLGNTSVMTAAGPALDVFLSDHFSLGAGAHVFFQAGQVVESGVSLPLRGAWFPGARGTPALQRRGLQFGLELAPGLALSALIRGAGFPLVFSAGLTAGYGWW